MTKTRCQRKQELHTVLISLQTDPKLAVDLMQDPPRDSVSLDILGLIQRHRGRLKSTFPGVKDAELMSHFSIELGSPRDAQSLVSSLIHVNGVESAYIKPEATDP